MQIIGYLCDHPDQALYQRDVEELFCVRRSTASRYLKDLERSGLLRRESVPQDARLKQLIPTDMARSIHENANQTFRALEEQMAQGLTASEIAQFLVIANKIQRNLAPAGCARPCQGHCAANHKQKECDRV